MNITHNNHEDSKLLEKAVAGTGFVMVLIGIAAGVQFYFSMGGNGFESAVYVGAGICIALVTIILLPIAITAWQNHKVIRSIIIFALWLCLLSLQIFAEFGFFAASQDRLESTNNVNSIGYTAAKARLDAANSKLSTMSNNASVDVAGLTSELESLNAKLTTVKMKKCPKGHYQNCIDPKNIEIGMLESKIVKIESQLGNGQGYKGVLAERDAALKDLQAAAQTNGVVTSNIAPVWLYAEKLLGKPARTIQVYVVAFISVIIEIWGSFSTYILMVGIGDYRRDDAINVTPVTENTIKNITPAPEKAVAQTSPAPVFAQPTLTKWNYNVNVPNAFTPTKKA